MQARKGPPGGGTARRRPSALPRHGEVRGRAGGRVAGTAQGPEGRPLRRRRPRGGNRGEGLGPAPRPGTSARVRGGRSRPYASCVLPTRWTAGRGPGRARPLGQAGQGPEPHARRDAWRGRPDHRDRSARGGLPAGCVPRSGSAPSGPPRAVSPRRRTCPRPSAPVGQAPVHRRALVRGAARAPADRSRNVASPSKARGPGARSRSGLERAPACHTRGRSARDGSGARRGPRSWAPCGIPPRAAGSPVHAACGGVLAAPPTTPIQWTAAACPGGGGVVIGPKGGGPAARRGGPGL